MLVLRRIAGLQHVERQLRRVVKEENILLHSISDSSSSHNNNNNKNNNNKSEEIETRKKIQNCVTVKDKILFRQIPVALSLLERSLTPLLIHKKKSSSSLSTSREINTDIKLLEELQKEKQESQLELNNELLLMSDKNDNILEIENTKSKFEKLNLLSISSSQENLKQKQKKQQERILSHPRRMLQLFSSLHFIEQERRKLYRYHLTRLETKLHSAEKALQIKQKCKKDDKKEILIKARQEVKEIKEDIIIIQNSLLARPYISAKLWRILLREEIWNSTMKQTQKKINNNDNSNNNKINNNLNSSLLVMLLCFTRISLGILQDVVQGNVLNTRSPRFVASLPSRKMRYNERKKKNNEENNIISDSSSLNIQKETISNNNNNNNNEDDMMALIMMSIRPENEIKKEKNLNSSDSTKEIIKINKSKLSELSSSSSLLPNNNSLIPKLRWLPPASCDALPLVLETLAMCSLILPSININELIIQNGQSQELFELFSTLQMTASLILTLPSSYENLEEHNKLHNILHRLEETMLKCGEISKNALITPQSTDIFLNISPLKAARLLLGLSSMQLLHTREYNSQQIITKLIIRIFPQLSTGTQRVFLEKSRQSSLFAFATRGQRMKIYREYGKEGAQSVLLNSVKTQARLQQRQIQIALRTKYIEEVNNRSIKYLAENIPIYSLITLFNLLVCTARDLSRQKLDNQGRLITASIFIVESILVSGSHSSSFNKNNNNLMLQPSDLPNLLASLSLLWPLVHERYEIMIQKNNSNDFQNNHHNKIKKGGNDSLAKSELIIISSVTDMVFNAINAAIAERVEYAEFKKNSLIDFNNKIKIISLDDIIATVNAISYWCNLLPNKKFTSHMETTARVLKQLFINDMQFWKELRQISKVKREKFLHTLSDVMQSLNMMDETVTKAISVVC